MIYCGQYSSWRDFEFLIRKYSSCASVYLSNSKLFSDRSSRSLGFHCGDNIQLQSLITQYFWDSISFKTNFLWSLLHVFCKQRRFTSCWRLVLSKVIITVNNFSGTWHCPVTQYYPWITFAGLNSIFHYLRFTKKPTKKALRLKRMHLTNKLPDHKALLSKSG